MSRQILGDRHVNVGIVETVDERSAGVLADSPERERETGDEESNSRSDKPLRASR